MGYAAAYTSRVASEELLAEAEDDASLFSVVVLEESEQPETARREAAMSAAGARREGLYMIVIINWVLSHVKLMSTWACRTR